METREGLCSQMVSDELSNSAVAVLGYIQLVQLTLSLFRELKNTEQRDGPNLRHEIQLQSGREKRKGGKRGASLLRHQ